MPIDRILIDEYDLNLYEIRIDDTVGQMIDKLNTNFREIKSNGGGRKGDMGQPGRPGCRGEGRIISGNGTGFGNDEIILSDSEIGYEQGSCLDYESDINQNEILVNKWTNRSLLLTNLTRGNNNNIESRIFTEKQLSINTLSAPYFDWKLKIYNCDLSGLGKHIHLLNSKAIETDNRFFCNSGFTIDNNFIANNIEILSISGRKNPDISGHEHRIEFISNYSEFKKSSTSQTIRFEIESTLETSLFKTGRFLLKEQTDNNDFRIADRTGWVGIWQDEIDTNETWEVVNYDNILINRVYFKYANVDIYKTYEDTDNPFEIDTNSFIRFKRMNNWVLIDYHIGLINKDSENIIELKTIQFKINHPTINMGCNTIGWFPGTIIEDESLNENKLKSFNFFKVDAVILDNNNLSFVISEKFSSEYVVVEYNELKTKFWNSGQIWATITDVICDEITITQDEICLTDLTLTQDGFSESSCPYNSYQEFVIDEFDYIPLFNLEIPQHPYLLDQIIIKYKYIDLLNPNNEILLTKNVDYITDDAYNITLLNISELQKPGILSVCYSGAYSLGNNTINDDDIIVFKNYEEYTIEELGSYFGERFRMGQAGKDGTSGTSGIGTSGTSAVDGTSGTGGAGTSGTSAVDGTSGTGGAGTSGTSGLGTSGTSGLGTSGTSAIGTSGTSAVDGTSGTGGTGTSGTSALNGTSGTSSNGTSGTSAIGTSGTSALNGTSGTSANGTSGTDGLDGTSGRDGIDAPPCIPCLDGTSGSSGRDGLNGTSGTSGIGT